MTRLIELHDGMQLAAKHIQTALQDAESTEKLKLYLSRPLVELGIDYAKAQNHHALLQDCTEAQQLKGPDAKKAILDVYNTHIEGALAFLRGS